MGNIIPMSRKSYLHTLTNEGGVNSYLDLTSDLTTGQETARIKLCGECVATFRADEHDLQWDCMGGTGDPCAACEVRNSTEIMRTLRNQAIARTFVIHDRYIVRGFKGLKTPVWQILQSSGWVPTDKAHINTLLAETGHLRQPRQ